ncbi:uncharacterized protein CHSO_3255 [Chryseobacterium sp. StRB126]|uniref:DUF1508 domain-containing protein n=1 Tax=Chryseobacterium sp. StRB126 TaxID=878220 RepID=UPI0004E982CF|nr:DUF1508 domain-containing protein [Chryseobacterium sp. StRB126]BAP32292.1 uncharacterized protein CHSO_3255 [Chryseobacterium sp. StRB126]
MGTLKWVFYQDSAEKWRWRATSVENGKIVGAATQGFSSRQKAVENARHFGYK